MLETLNCLGGLHTEEDFNLQETIFSSTISNMYKKFKIHQCPFNGPGIIVLMMMAINEKMNTDKFDSSSFKDVIFKLKLLKFVMNLKKQI